MADRWFAGIPLGFNQWVGSTWVAEAGYDNYFIAFRVQTNVTTKPVSFQINGTPANSPNGAIVGFIHPTITSQVEFSTPRVINELRIGTPIYPTTTASVDDTTIIAYGSFARLPIALEERTLDEVEKQITPSSITTLNATFTIPLKDVAWVAEYQIDSANKPIVQPMHQATPAVADELYIVSTSANDTLAGTGAQKVSILYYDSTFALKGPIEVEMAGTTPVDLIATIPDLWLTKVMWVSQHGTSDYNEGDIYLQDVTP